MKSLRRHIGIIISTYDGALPLSHFLKQYFRTEPRLGSRDRRILSDMAYSWYRASRGIPDTGDFETRLAACLFLCDMSTPHTRAFIPAGWLPEDRGDSVPARISRLKERSGIDFDPHSLLPFTPLLSPGISPESWLESMLRQPRLFLRVPAARYGHVSRTLQDKGISFSVTEYRYPLAASGHSTLSYCLSLDNGTDAGGLLPEDSYTVQDASSQETGMFFAPGAGMQWWDCCAGAGGKSLLLSQIAPAAQLTVSDRRPAILNNLARRFRQYHLSVPEIREADVSDRESLKQIFGARRFDRIICDVPCSGSGTWARTPEQLHFFREAQLDDFSLLQQQIAANALEYLKPGGRLIYITCSVFAAENEHHVTRLTSSRSDIKLVGQQLINGLSGQADSMFAAVLERS